MTTRTLTAAAALAAVVLLSGGCAATSIPVDEAPSGAAPAAATCDPAILEFLPQHGYPNPEPRAALSLPDGASTALTPVCVVHDAFEGAPRDAAFFAADAQEQFVSDLESAGYSVSPDFGDAVLLSPSGHQLGLGLADVSGTTLLFVAF